MTRLPRIAFWTSMALGVTLSLAGCHQNQAPATDTSSTATTDQSQDPAAANLAPASYDTSGAAQSAPAPDSGSASAPAPAPAAAESDTGSSGDDSDYAPQPVASAAEPPPALPDYEQPPCPGDGYIWTPGYWGYQQTGYYWVPGAWTHAPYTGALWTPGYWGYRQNRYNFYPGHWGTHIGYYGGVNYGFGYVGVGYEGGYWDHDHFSYNRAVTNVNNTNVRNVYNYTNITRVTNTRVSYNGGRGGIEVHPRPVERVAWHEPVAPRMTAQVQHEQNARTDRTQFVAVNHGHPTAPALNHPLEADHEVRPMPAKQAYARPEGHPVPQGRAVGQEKRANGQEKKPERNPHDR